MRSSDEPLRSVKFLYLLLKYVKNWPYIAKIIAMNKKNEILKVILRDGNEISFKGVFNLYLFLQLLEKGWKVKEFYDTDSVLICKEVCLKIRTSRGWDLGHIDEIYERHIYGDRFSGIIIDVGASNADSSIFFAIRGAQKVIALEPFPESYELGKYTVEINNLSDKVILLPYALADYDNYTELKVSRDSPNTNSINPSIYIENQGIKFDERIMVKTISLSTIIKKYNINRISLLKMDCEGCEYVVLRNASYETLNKIDNIILEFHDYPKDIPDILRRAGFKVEYQDKPLGILKAYKKL